MGPGIQAVRGELTVEPPREAEKDLGNVSANRSYSAKPTDLDRYPPTLLVCLGRVSDRCDDCYSKSGSQQAFALSRGRSRAACGPNTHD